VIRKWDISVLDCFWQRTEKCFPAQLYQDPTTSYEYLLNISEISKYPKKYPDKLWKGLNGA